MMIKGVNKKVIEINRPDSAYFERAVLYLKPDVKDIPPHAAQMETLDYFAPHKKSRKSFKAWVFFFLGMSVSALGCCVLFYFFP